MKISVLLRMSRIRTIIDACLGSFMIGSLWVALAASRGLDHRWKAPDPRTGHTIEIALRGWGVFYITESEWSNIAIYWNVAYSSIVVLLFWFGLRFILNGYRGFMDAWRAKD